MPLEAIEQPEWASDKLYLKVTIVSTSTRVQIYQKSHIRQDRL